jgi:CRP/FNR family cyclic AMP-dependent transcriptional regulator
VDPLGILAQAPVFGQLTAEQTRQLLPTLRERHYARGEPVWTEGDRVEAIHILAEGQLKAFRVSQDGGEVILEFRSAVDLVGEVGVFHPSGHRLVNTSAMEPSTCLTVPKTVLLTFLNAHPTAMRAMLEQLSMIAGKAASSLSEVAFEDIRSRVAGALLALGDEFGQATADGVQIKLRLSQGALAALVAASRENVNRALSSLIASGAVSQRSGRFVLHDRSVLERARLPPSVPDL